MTTFSLRAKAALAAVVSLGKMQVDVAHDAQLLAQRQNVLDGVRLVAGAQPQGGVRAPCFAVYRMGIDLDVGTD